MGGCLVRIRGESFSRLNSGLQLLKKQEVTMRGKERGDKEGEDLEAFSRKEHMQSLCVKREQSPRRTVVDLH